MKTNSEAKILFDRIGKARGLSFELKDYRDGVWFVVVAVKDFSIEDFDCKREEDFRKRREEYEFDFEGASWPKLVFRHRSLLSKEKENRIWEEALDWMLREARCRDVTLKTGRKKGAPMFCGLDVRRRFLKKPIVVLDKGICTREQLEIWLDLQEKD